MLVWPSPNSHSGLLCIERALGERLRKATSTIIQGIIRQEHFAADLHIEVGRQVFRRGSFARQANAPPGAG